MIKAILGSLVLVVVGVSQAAEKTENRALSAQETAAKNAVASSGFIHLSLKMVNRIITSSGRERKLLVAGQGRYQLVSGSASECQSSKMTEMPVESGYFSDPGKVTQYGIISELSQDEAEDIEIPRLTYVRYSDHGIFNSKEIICYYQLEHASVVPAIDVSLIMSNMAQEIPITLLPAAEAAPKEILMNLSFNTIGWHGTYPSCQSTNCAVPAQIGRTTSVLIKYVSDETSTPAAQKEGGS